MRKLLATLILLSLIFCESNPSKSTISVSVQYNNLPDTNFKLLKSENVSYVNYYLRDTSYLKNPETSFINKNIYNSMGCFLKDSLCNFCQPIRFDFGKSWKSDCSESPASTQPFQFYWKYEHTKYYSYRRVSSCSNDTAYDSTYYYYNDTTIREINGKYQYSTYVKGLQISSHYLSENNKTEKDTFIYDGNGYLINDKHYAMGSDSIKWYLMSEYLIKNEYWQE
jgi:hypothetical protein